ncbi:hypothetical protein MACK_000872 [Theileria orientalis]|uniref:Uncharacterized protein n=1 Tax=Theileria orientalis TaxID=68886 RepID=A0A976MAS3_THEOR|nr:hypothetical protein MACK_000872 [Theileria orientalis]
MIRLSNRRCVSEGFKTFLNSIQRYRLLNQGDKKKLLFQHNLQNVSSYEMSEINKKLDLPDHTPASHRDEELKGFNNVNLIKRELSRQTSHWFKQRRIVVKDKGVTGRSKFFMGIDPTKELDPIEIKYDIFSSVNETESLVSDVKKAVKYEQVQEILEESRPVPQHMLTDNFMDVLSRAIEENLSNLERPVLTNELSDYKAAYAMKRASIRNLLINKCVRNSFEESRVDKFIDSQKSVYTQRLNAPLPPEVLEPIAAFRGDVYYSFSPMQRLQDKLKGINTLVDGIASGDEEIVSKLPEFERKSDYPFDNYYGFKSAVPNEVTGSIKMGKQLNEESLRYPNLQCVAHSLPKDRKYRAIVAHSIKVLERARGWDHLSKVKAINKLVEVYNNMSSSRYYGKVMEDSVPTEDERPKVVKTLSRQEVFNKGLKYIPSLFRNHWNRVKRKN